MADQKELEFHWKQYEMLHGEILQRIEALWQLEFWAVLALAGFYAWFFKEGGNLRWQIGFIAVLIPIAGLLRTIVTGYRIEDIASYLRDIESGTLKDSALLGWERHLADLPGECYLPVVGVKCGTIVSSSLVWGFLLVITLLAPLLSLPRRPQKPQ